MGVGRFAVIICCDTVVRLCTPTPCSVQGSDRSPSLSGHGRRIPCAQARQTTAHFRTALRSCVQRSLRSKVTLLRLRRSRSAPRLRCHGCVPIARQPWFDDCLRSCLIVIQARLDQELKQHKADRVAAKEAIGSATKQRQKEVQSWLRVFVSVVCLLLSVLSVLFVLKSTKSITSSKSTRALRALNYCSSCSYCS